MKRRPSRRRSGGGAGTRAVAVLRRCSTSSLVLGLALAHLGASRTVAAQSREADAPKQTFRASSQIVLLNVHVAGVAGTTISDLTREDFVVYEDDRLQHVTFFEPPSDTTTAPASVLLLVDTSSSMSAEDMARVRRAALDFVAEAREGNDIAVAGFHDRLQPVCAFTKDRTVLEEGIARLSPTPGGGTALYDALWDAVAMLEAGPHPRGALVLFTDGKDLDSRRAFSELENRLEASAVVVYAVGQYGPASRDRYMTGEKYFKPPELEVNLNPVWALRRLAELTGGRASFPTTDQSVSHFLTRAAQDWEQVYVLGYRPAAAETGSAKSPHPRWRSVEVRLETERFPPDTYVLRTRRGYRR